MERQDIEYYLSLLGDELAKRFQNPVRVLIFGGVYMLLQVGNRESTKDVDAMLLDLEDMTGTNLPNETKQFQSAVRSVARKHKLDKSWFNDDGAFFVRGFTPNVDIYYWKSFNKLEVYFPDMEAVFVLKVMGFRKKDREDIKVLMQKLGITTRRHAQSIVNDYVAGRWQTEYCLQETFDELFNGQW